LPSQTASNFPPALQIAHPFRKPECGFGTGNNATWQRPCAGQASSLQKINLENIAPIN
jgi:hypothetical protein